MSNIRADLVLATRAYADAPNGLATFLVEVPAFVWMEILTHKRIARNASSSRAEGVQRHQGHGYYTPDAFYEACSGMGHGDALKPLDQEFVAAWWAIYHEDLYKKVAALNDHLKARGYTGLAKEQINRLLPTTKMVRGVLTATEPAWRAFLELRNNRAADDAMQELARIIERLLAQQGLWRESREHMPFQPDAVIGKDYKSRVLTCAARIARTSYGGPGPGQRSDHALAMFLAAEGHWSPFEHCARWRISPKRSALNSLPDDLDSGFCGWQNVRSEIESGVLE